MEIFSNKATLNWRCSWQNAYLSTSSVWEYKQGSPNTSELNHTKVVETLKSAAKIEEFNKEATINVEEFEALMHPPPLTQRQWSKCNTCHVL